MNELGFFSDTHLQAFVKSLAGQVTAFVETGTEEGKTTRWAARYFGNVFTCDVSLEYLSKAEAALPDHVKLFELNSPNFIYSIRNDAGTFPLFFLDAHWLDYWPLQDELKTIEAHYHKAVVIVHDCAVPGRHNFWYCRGGGADHDGPVLNWEYIKQAIDTAYYRLFYPTYKGETPGYCVLFRECEPFGDLRDLAEAQC